jgi:large subunit ribosomal protein L22
MEKTVKVQVKNIPVSPYRARLVANLVRNLDVEKAMNVLTFLNKKGALHIKKAFDTGIANSKDILGLEPKSLKIAKLTIGEGMKGRGVIFASRGRVSQLIKRKSHINLELKAK